MRRGLRLVLISAGLAMGAIPAFGEIVFSQSPNQSGGFAADTDHTYLGHPHSWEYVADNFLLNASSDITQIAYWGFYLNAVFGPSSETMKVRFLGSSENDGLPDESAVLYEQIVQNPQRQETGQLIFTLNRPPEYRYTIDLASPVSIEAGASYWLEIVQVGDPNSDFFWENAIIFSVQEKVAFKNQSSPDWSYFDRANFAFQLLTPEPSAFGLMAIGLLLFSRRRGRREYRARSD